MWRCINFFDTISCLAIPKDTRNISRLESCFPLLTYVYTLTKSLLWSRSTTTHWSPFNDCFINAEKYSLLQLLKQKPTKIRSGGHHIEYKNAEDVLALLWSLLVFLCTTMFDETWQQKTSYVTIIFEKKSGRGISLEEAGDNWNFCSTNDPFLSLWFNLKRK